MSATMSFMLLMCIIYIFNFVGTVVHNEKNTLDSFNFYKEKYDKKYDSEKAEKQALRNFVQNMNDVVSLNEKATDKDTLYVLNKFADINPDEYLDKHAIKIQPYDNVFDISVKSSFLREKKLEKKGTLPLYDLSNADALFEKHMKKYNKTLTKSRTERTTHFLRFVKTLAELNKKNFEGEGEMMKVQENADVVNEPQDVVF